VRTEQGFKPIRENRGGNYAKYLINQNGSLQYATECNWKIFEEEFWPTVGLRYKLRYAKFNISNK